MLIGLAGFETCLGGDDAFGDPSKMVGCLPSEQAEFRGKTFAKVPRWRGYIGAKSDVGHASPFSYLSLFFFFLRKGI